MITHAILQNQNDRIIFASLKGGQASIIFVVGTQTVQKAASIHGTSPVCTAALGRTLLGTGILGARLKNDEAKVSVSINGGGPIGKINAVCSQNQVKGYVDTPNINLSLNAEGKLDVGAVVGKDGYLTVVKDLQLKAPYVGKTELISGEIAEDFTYYLAVSEQQPCLVSLGVLVNGDTVLSAGGIMVAPMPGCTEETIEALEIRSMMMADISKELTFDTPEDLLKRWFGDMDVKVLSSTPFSYACDCSRFKMEKALLSLGKQELQNILNDEQEGAELVCHFCHQKHQFTDDDIKQLLEESTHD